MKKVIMMATIALATLYSAQAQTSNSTPPATDGTTKNSGTGNATNGSATVTGTANASGTGAVGATNGTSYGMQTTAPISATTNSSDSSRRKDPKAKPNKND